MSETISAITLAIVLIDCVLFVLIYRKVAKIGKELTVALTTPEALQQLGRGFAAGMRSSTNGAKGKESQVTKAEENAVLAEVLESWMSVNTPLIAMLEQQVPDIKRIIKQHPKAAMAIVQQFGPMIEKKIGQAAGDMMGKVGGMMQ